MDPKGYCFLIIFAFTAVVHALEEGEPCVSSIGWEGVCLLSYECSNLGAQVANGYTPELCNTTGPVICCPNEKKIPVTEEQTDDTNYQIVAAEQRERPLFTPAKMEPAHTRKMPSAYMKTRRRRPSKKRHAHILVKTYDEDINSIRIRTHRVKPVRRKRKPMMKRPNPFASNHPLDFKVLAKQQLASQIGPYLAGQLTNFGEPDLNQQLIEAQLAGDEEAALLLSDMSSAQATARPSRSTDTTRVSQLMCETYGELVTEMVAELSKSGLVPVKSEKCSVASIPNSRSNYAQIGEYPHAVGLGYMDASKRIIWGKCSGALISDQYVITSAHCTHSPIGKPISVSLGSIKLGSDIEIGVSEITQHPLYNKTTFANNLALIKLAKIPKLSDSLRPACLPSSAYPAPKHFFATYWSNNEAILEIKVGENNTKKFSDVNNLSLQKMKMSYVQNSDCDIYPDLTDSFMCARVESVRRSSSNCQGNGGDPIQVKNEGNKCMYNLLGIAVENICDESVPIAFMKLNHFLSWIENIVWA